MAILPQGQFSSAQVAAIAGIAPVQPPRGASWLSQVGSGFDIYAKGFVVTPTHFYDPTASSSLCYGTFAQPYNTPAQLMTVFAGDCRKKKLGIKRGTTSRMTAPLTITGYGTADDPFYIVPYGDASALPIWTTDVVTARTDWSVEDGAHPTLYSLGANQTPSGNESEVWDYSSGVGVRYWKRTSKAALETAHASNPTFGFAYWDGGDLWIIPANSSSLDHLEITRSDGADGTDVGIKFTGSGGIVLAGQHVRTTTGAAGMWQPSGNGDFFQRVGCWMEETGIDDGVGTAGGSSAAMSYAGGVSGSTNRLTNIYDAGNYARETMNNSVECTRTDKVLIEYNYGLEIGGKSIVELYAANTNTIIRYCKGLGAQLTKMSLQTQTSVFASWGVWQSGFAEDESTASAALNHDNLVHDCIIDGVDRGVSVGCGGLNIQNNTIVAGYLNSGNSGAGITAGYTAVWTGDISDNYLYARAGSLTLSIDIASNATWSGDYNFFSGEGFSSTNTLFIAAPKKSDGTQQYYSNLTGYKSDQNVVTARDQNSLTGAHYALAPTVIPVQLTASTYAPVGSTLNGGSAISGRTRDFYGKAASTKIGAVS